MYIAKHYKVSMIRANKVKLDSVEPAGSHLH